ncbi:hypothetical protein [Nitratifractor sp.]
MILRLKDQALSRALTLAVNAKISSYGRVTKLRLDSSSRIIEAELDLEGEVMPLRLTLRDYRFVHRGGKLYLSIGKIESSRRWIESLADDYLRNREVELPERYGKLTEKLL